MRVTGMGGFQEVSGRCECALESKSETENVGDSTQNPVFGERWFENGPELHGIWGDFTRAKWAAGLPGRVGEAPAEPHPLPLPLRRAACPPRKSINAGLARDPFQQTLGT